MEHSRWMECGIVPGIPKQVSRAVLGTSGFRDARAHAILDAFVNAGGTCIDTARAYGNGIAEKVVGDWVRARGGHRDLVIIAKGAHPPTCNPDAIRPELDETRERLGCDVIDLYMLHRDEVTIPVEEFVDALDAEVDAGSIMTYGVSNWTTARVAAANAVAQRRGRRGIVALSNQFSLAEMISPIHPGTRGIDEEDRRYLAEHHLALFAWSSQARGFFSDVDPARLDPRMPASWDTPQNRARRERARELAAEFAVHPINIALAYVLAQPFPTYAIIGPQSSRELDVALEALRIRLDDQQRRWLEVGDAPAVQ